MGTSTRKVAMRLWDETLPSRNPAQLVRELYAEENKGEPGAIRLAGYGRADLPGHQPA